MGKTIFLVRHANAEEASNNQKDIERSLSSTGHRQAPKMATKMKYDQEVPEVIITSSANRAVATTSYFSESFDLSDQQVVIKEELYESSTRILLATINNLPDKYKKVYIVGHNPGLTYMAEYLTGEELGVIPTTGIVKINTDFEQWSLVSKDSGQVIFHIYPKMFGY